MNLLITDMNIVKPTNIIDETLELAITRPQPTVEELTECLQTGLPDLENQTIVPSGLRIL